MYKALQIWTPQSGNTNPPPPPGACTWRIPLKKQSKNGQFTSNYTASPIDFETQISLRR